FERALNGFAEQRLLTEWVIIINGLICTVLILTLPQDNDECAVIPTERFAPLVWRVLGAGAVATLACILAQFGTIRLLYGDHFAGHAGRNGKGQKRFGEEAEWRVQPNLRKGEHQ
ncbi:MAG: hypothetical protein IT367_18710, partial [Candidatus Hydrogenedentes bacterium]|nr:hypothetical protein [Candidatus Hydrogenedentota bacterium]